MRFFFLKTVISGFLVGLVSSVGRRHPMAAGILAALPIVSLLALCFLYYESNQNREQVAKLSTSIGSMVLPTAIFLFLFPVLLRKQFEFTYALMISLFVLVLLDIIILIAMKRLGL
jgi:hypothetical protein